MKGKLGLVSKLGLVLLVLALTAGAGQAQEPPPPEGEEGMEPQSADVHIFPTMSYQGSLTESGTPVDGTRSMTFRLFNVSSGGTAVWTQGPQNVQVRDGVFVANLGGASHFDVNDFDQNLWLEIEVEGTILPRQRLRGAPYAMTLAPGADISGVTDPGVSILFASNFGAGDAIHGWSVKGHGVSAQGMSDGLDGSALYARANTTDGIALWAANEHNFSTDATMVSQNKGTGDLFKGFGGDGGVDEFRVTNSGAVMTKARSALFFPGSEFIKNVSSDTTRWDVIGNGSVQLYRGAAPGQKIIYVPISLPGMLYGQNVEVKSITIYYKCENGANNYISRTYLDKQTGVDDYVNLIDNSNIRNSNSPTSYTLNVNHTLSDTYGILSLLLNLQFANDTQYIKFGGVKVELDHHPLY